MCMQIIAGIVSCENIITGGKRTFTELKRGLEVKGGENAHLKVVVEIMSTFSICLIIWIKKMQYSCGEEETNGAVCVTAELIQHLPSVKIGVALLSLPLAFEESKIQEINSLKFVCIWGTTTYSLLKVVSRQWYLKCKCCIPCLPGLRSSSSICAIRVCTWCSVLRKNTSAHSASHFTPESQRMYGSIDVSWIDYENWAWCFSDEKSVANT